MANYTSPLNSSTLPPDYQFSDDFFDRISAARHLNISWQWLDKNRGGRTPQPPIPYYVIGRRVLYHRADLDAYLDSCRVPAGTAVSPNDGKGDKGND